jgi:hypothetical protein
MSPIILKIETTLYFPMCWVLMERVTCWWCVTQKVSRLFILRWKAPERVLERSSCCHLLCPLHRCLGELQRRAEKGSQRHVLTNEALPLACQDASRCKQCIPNKATLHFLPTGIRRSSENSGTVSPCLLYFNYYRPICSIEEALDNT